MKILAASDLHNDRIAANRLAEYAEKEDVDLVLILGDISIFGDLERGMIRPFIEKKRNVALVAGNHEMPGTVESLAEEYKITDLEKHAFVYDNVGVFGSGGANIGPNITSEKEIFTNLEHGFGYMKGSEKTIMATHMHPEGSLIEKFSFPGSGGVRKAIDKFIPDIHVCGHIHEMEGFEEKIGKTRIFCVGKRGKIIEV